MEPGNGVLRARRLARGRERRVGGAIAQYESGRSGCRGGTCLPVGHASGQLSMPLLVLRLRDEVGANATQPRDLPARARRVELPEHGASVFETAPQAAAQAMESFLR